MPAQVEIRLSRNFAKQAKGVFEKYQFEVGVLEDKNHKLPKSAKAGLSTLAGGPRRKLGRTSDKSISDVSEAMRARVGNFYTRPFKSSKNRDILNFAKSFMELCVGKGSRNRAKNYLQAIVRNPILRGDYGKNTPAWARIKGFNRLMIDTGQLFNAIKAKVKTNVSR